MNRIVLAAGITAAACAAAVPAVLGLSGNPSFSQHIPVPVPSHAQLIQFDDRGDVAGDRLSTSASVSPSSRHERGDDRSSSGSEPEPGDDHGGHRTSSEPEPADDHGGRRTSSEPEPSDDRSGASTSPEPEPSDDHGGASTSPEPEPSDDRGRNRGPGGGSDDSGQTSTSSSDDHGGHGRGGDD